MESKIDDKTSEEKDVDTVENSSNQKVISWDTLQMVILLQSRFRAKITWRLYNNFFRHVSMFPKLSRNKNTAIGTLVVIWAMLVNFFLLAIVIWGIFNTQNIDHRVPTSNDIQLSNIQNKENWLNLQYCPYQGITQNCDGINKTISFSPEVREYQLFENNHGTLTPRFSLMQQFPHFEGFWWQIGVISHLIIGLFLFLLFPFVFNDILVHVGLLNNMANSEQKLTKMFGKCGPKLSHLHHYLLGIQMTLGLVIASFRFHKRGFDVYKWYAFVGFSLDLYLQFIGIAALGAVSVANAIVLSTYGLDFKGFRKWQKFVLRWINVISVIIQILCTITFFVLSYPISKDIGFLIVFCLQIPICIFFSIRNITFWAYDSIGDRLFLWQAALSRSAMCCAFISSTTFLANVLMRMGYMPGVGLSYLVGNALWLYGSWVTDKTLKNRGHGIDMENFETLEEKFSWYYWYKLFLVVKKQHGIANFVKFLLTARQKKRESEGESTVRKEILTVIKEVELKKMNSSDKKYQVQNRRVEI